MITLTLTPSQADALDEVLVRALEELRVEIHHTDTWSYKKALKDQAADLRAVLTALEAEEISAAV